MLIGSNLLTNGDFEVGGTPPNSWIAAYANETISTDGGSGVSASDAMLVVGTAAGNAGAYQTFNAAVVPGQAYKLSVYVKALSEATYSVVAYDVTGSAAIWTLGNTEETAGDWTTNVEKVFVTPTGCISARIYLIQYAGGAGVTTLFDDASVYRVLYPGGSEYKMFQDLGMT